MLAELEVQEKRFPCRPEAHNQRARSLLALERTEEAIAGLKGALKADADFIPARSALEDLGEAAPPRAVPPAAPGKGSEGWREAWSGAHEAMRRSDHPRVIECASRLLESYESERAYSGAEIEARLLRAEARLKLKDIRAVADLVRGQRALFQASASRGISSGSAWFGGSIQSRIWSVSGRMGMAVGPGIGG